MRDFKNVKVLLLRDLTNLANRAAQVENWTVRRFLICFRGNFCHPSLPKGTLLLRSSAFLMQ